MTNPDDIGEAIRTLQAAARILNTHNELAAAAACARVVGQLAADRAMAVIRPLDQRNRTP